MLSMESRPLLLRECNVATFSLFHRPLYTVDRYIMMMLFDVYDRHLLYHVLLIDVGCSQGRRFPPKLGQVHSDPSLPFFCLPPSTLILPSLIPPALTPNPARGLGRL